MLGASFMQVNGVTMCRLDMLTDGDAERCMCRLGGLLLGTSFESLSGTAKLERRDDSYRDKLSLWLLLGLLPCVDNSLFMFLCCA